MILTVAFSYTPYIANICGYLISLALGFFVAKRYVFFSSKHFAAEGVRYVFSFALCFFLNLLVLWLALNLFHLHVIMAQILAAVAYTIAMYLLTRCFVFKVTSIQSLEGQN